MLEFLRRFYGSALGKAVTILVGFLFIVGFSFLPYLMGGGLGRANISPQNIATVNGKAISMNEFNLYYNNLESFYRRLYGASLTEKKIKELNLKGEALSSLIAGKVLEGRASTFGVAISKGYLAGKIAAIPGFQHKGEFSDRLFNLVLQQNHLTPSIFERRYNSEITRSFMREIIQRSLLVTNEQIIDDYKIQNRSVSFEAAVFKSKADAERFIKKALFLNSGFMPLSGKYNGKAVKFPFVSSAGLILSSGYKKYGFNQNVVDAAFSQQVGAVSTEPVPLISGFAVIKVKKIKFPGAPVSKEEKISFTRTYMFSRQSEFLDDYVGYLESKADIKINKKALKF